MFCSTLNRKFDDCSEIQSSVQASHFQFYSVEHYPAVRLQFIENRSTAAAYFKSAATFDESILRHFWPFLKIKNVKRIKNALTNKSHSHPKCKHNIKIVYLSLTIKVITLRDIPVCMLCGVKCIFMMQVSLKEPRNPG